MDEHNRTVGIDDWEGAVTEIERFYVDGHLHTESDLVGCTIGNATVEIHANGRLEGSMPLHEFDGRIHTLAFDHDEGTITAESEELSYTVRRP
ncbi:hypothetical protein [Halalkalicoccus subterraneus]|uniref:hypothetical protein n=1 Tax=Halalkalicoccus subterraneus TaxID=2675002 RepID=UPI000EFD0FB8|nr:hypothetical protein [Halalkalicoccus subterraneus]